MNQDKVLIIDLDDSVFKTTEKEKKEWRNLQRTRLLKDYQFLDETMSDEEMFRRYVEHVRQKMENMSENQRKEMNARCDKELQEIVDSFEKDVENASS